MATEVEIGRDAAKDANAEKLVILKELGIDFKWWIAEVKDKAENATVTKIASDKGIITDEREYDDNRIQLDALKEIGKAADFYPAEKHDLRGDFSFVEFTDTERAARLMSIMETVKKRAEKEGG